MKVSDMPGFTVRVKPETKMELQRIAKSNYRTLSAEIQAVLERHVAQTTTADRQQRAA